MNKSRKYAPEVRERAVRLVLEHERENRELKRANEILRKASAYFAQTELAPSTFRDHKARERDPSRSSARAPGGALRPEIRRVWDENRHLYGAMKVWNLDRPHSSLGYQTPAEFVASQQVQDLLPRVAGEASDSPVVGESVFTLS